MSFQAHSVLWRWLADTPQVLRLVVPLVMLGVIVMFVRADIKNRECVQVCKTQGHAGGYHVGGSVSGHRCMCVDRDGKNIRTQAPKQNLNEE
jgi:hypothetical protein